MSAVYEIDTLVHELSDDDFDSRNEFCETMEQLCNQDNNKNDYLLRRGYVLFECYC